MDRGASRLWVLEFVGASLRGRPLLRCDARPATAHLGWAVRGAHGDPTNSMRQQTDQRKLWLQTIGVLLVIGLLLAWFIRSETKPLNNIELGIEVADIHTYATAASLLTDLISTTNCTQTYFETQTSLLRDKVKADEKPGVRQGGPGFRDQTVAGSAIGCEA